MFNELNEIIDNNKKTRIHQSKLLHSGGGDLKGSIMKHRGKVETRTDKMDEMDCSVLIEQAEHGGFQLLDLIIREHKSHMTCKKFKVFHWWKFYLSKKSFARFALQSECCYFNQ